MTGLSVSTLGYVDRRDFLTLAVAGGVGAAAGCGGGQPERATRETVTLGDTVNDTNPQVAAERYFGSRLSELTGGRYEVQVVPGGALGDHNKMNQQVRTGTLPLTKSFFGNLTAFDPRLGVLSLPYVFVRQEDLFTALDGQLGRECTAILDRYDLVALAYFDSGSRNVYNKVRPVRAPADIKGLRLRVPQDVVAIDTLNQLGGRATPMATNEIYSALARGVIDGAENNPIFYVGNRHVEHAKYWSWTRHQYGVDALLASKKWMAGLDPQVQEALREAGRDAQVKERQLWKAGTDTIVADAVAEGAVMNDDVDVAAFQRAVRPVIDKHRSTFADLMRFLPT